MNASEETALRQQEEGERQFGGELHSARRVTLVGLILDACLGVIKVLIGFLYNSYALVADGIHSFSDVVSDIMVLVLFQISREEPDEDHPYGHERFETLGAVLLGSILIALAGALAWEAVQRVMSTALSAPGWPVLLVALVAVLGKEWIYHYTLRVGRAIRSDLIVANAWHSRTDALSSIIVMLGASGAMFGFPWLDAAAACGIAVIVAKIGWRLAWDNIKELVDTAMPMEKQRHLREIAEATEGVRAVNAIKSRRMGSDFLLDINLQVDPQVSVSEGHEIGVRAEHRLLEAVPDVREVAFHIDAENEELQHAVHAAILPSRSAVAHQLEDRWRDLINFQNTCPPRLHYLSDEVSVELYLESRTAVNEDARNQQCLTCQLKSRTGDLPWIGDIKIWYADEFRTGPNRN